MPLSSFFSEVDVVVSVGEVDPVTKKCISDTIFFVFANGGHDSNVDSVVFSRSVKKISAYQFLFNIRLQMY